MRSYDPGPMGFTEGGYHGVDGKPDSVLPCITFHTDGRKQDPAH